MPSGLFAGYYPFPREEKFYARPGMEFLIPAENLSHAWRDPYDKEWRAPFWDSDTKELILSRYFDLPKNTDSLYLYFEGLAWTSSIYLNDRLLLIHRDPFRDILIPLDSAWLKPMNNQLKVVIENKGEPTPFFHAPAIGIHKQVWLLSLSQAKQYFPTMPLAFPKDSIVVYTHYTPKHLYNVSREHLLRDIKTLKNAGAKYIYFTIPPSNRDLQIFAEEGFFQVKHYHHAQHILWFNAWPLEKSGHYDPSVFWFLPSGDTGSGFLKWFSQKDLDSCARKQENFSLVLILLLPLLGLLLVRIVSPQVFFNQIRWLFTRRLEREMIANRKLLRPNEVKLLSFVHLLISSASITLFVYFLFIRCLNPENFVQGSSNALFYEIVISNVHPLWLLCGIFFFQLSIVAFRLILIEWMAFIFRLNYLSRIYLDFNVLGNYPLNLFLLGFSIYLFYAPDNQSEIIISLWPAIFLIYFFRNLWVITSGLYLQYRFHPILIFLYICTFEILPWLLVI